MSPAAKGVRSQQRVEVELESLRSCQTPLEAPDVRCHLGDAAAPSNTMKATVAASLDVLPVLTLFV